jgi:hypothetical protein
MVGYLSPIDVETEISIASAAARWKEQNSSFYTILKGVPIRTDFTARKA